MLYQGILYGTRQQPRITLRLIINHIQTDFEENGVVVLEKIDLNRKLILEKYMTHWNTEGGTIQISLSGFIP